MAGNASPFDRPAGPFDRHTRYRASVVMTRRNSRGARTCLAVRTRPVSVEARRASLAEHRLALDVRSARRLAFPDGH